MTAELCCNCESPTGRAGKMEDSIYLRCGIGPLCEDCWLSIVDEVHDEEGDDGARLGNEADALLCWLEKNCDGITLNDRASTQISADRESIRAAMKEGDATERKPGGGI